MLTRCACYCPCLRRIAQNWFMHAREKLMAEANAPRMTRIFQPKYRRVDNRQELLSVRLHLLRGQRTRRGELLHLPRQHYLQADRKDIRAFSRALNFPTWPIC